MGIEQNSDSRKGRRKGIEEEREKIEQERLVRKKELEEKRKKILVWFKWIRHREGT
jgi:hypothetical protein